MSQLSRRDFLKILKGVTPAILLPHVISRVDQIDQSKPNVIVFLFDAMSARNLSVYGYPRSTTPNLERFAEHAIVYHSHTASGNFTIPATSSLLTGTYPWTHRAINHRGMVHQKFVDKNIFHAIQNGYHRLAFPQNVWANLVVSQFIGDIDTLMPTSAYSSSSYMTSEWFDNDLNMALRSLDDFAFKRNEQASLLLAPFLSAIYFRDAARLSSDGYPKGIPNDENYPLYFRLEDVFDGLTSMIPRLQSTFAYIHLYPPHAPYRPTNQFFKGFLDNYRPEKKPVHPLSAHVSNTRMASARRVYDEYIASIDGEIGKMFDQFKKEGVFENSYIIVTADHGEMFERGTVAHTTPLLYAPVENIPLLISTPGQEQRRDIYSPTNAVDLLPTIANLTGNPIPDWSEGQLLPELGGSEDFERSSFSVEAKTNSSFGTLRRASVSMRKGAHKLIFYKGYTEEDIFELYDLSLDFDEIHDLYPERPAILKRLKEELLESLFEADKLYQE